MIVAGAPGVKVHGPEGPRREARADALAGVRTTDVPGRAKKMHRDMGGKVDDSTGMNNTRDHIIFFFAQKMYYLERIGKTEAYNRLIDLFEQINLERLLTYLTQYYSVDISREMDDFFLEEGELVFVSRRGNTRYKHVYRDNRLWLVGIELLD
jgi:hypothetical protein